MYFLEATSHFLNFKSIAKKNIRDYFQWKYRLSYCIFKIELIHRFFQDFCVLAKNTYFYGTPFNGCFCILQLCIINLLKNNAEKILTVDAIQYSYCRYSNVDTIITKGRYKTAVLHVGVNDNLSDNNSTKLEKL